MSIAKSILVLRSLLSARTQQERFLLAQDSRSLRARRSTSPFESEAGMTRSLESLSAPAIGGEFGLSAKSNLKSSQAKTGSEISSSSPQKAQAKL